MSVTLYEDQGGYGDYDTFTDDVKNLENKDMDLFTNWNDEVSSFYTTESVTMYEDAYGKETSFGEGVTFGPGFWSLQDLLNAGIDNDSISSFYFA